MIVLLFFLVVCVCLSFLAIGFGLYVYCKLTVGKCNNSVRLCDKTVLITGGNSGVGLEAATEFARRGAHLILACRDLAKANEAIEQISYQTGNHDIELHKVDLSLLESVETLIDRLKYVQIDILCLHAGMGPTDPRQETAEGFELTFATNHLGHFHLANLMLPLLNDNARIIFTTSMAHEYVRLDFSDLQLASRYNGARAYACSKLMNVYHARELAERLRSRNITVNVQHPGLYHMSILKDFAIGNWITKNFIAPLYGKTALQGAQTLIYLATSDKLNGVSGQMFRDCKTYKLNEVASDKRAPKKLWEYSEKLIQETRKISK